MSALVSQLQSDDPDLFLSEDRLRLLEVMSRTLTSLDNGELTGNCHNRLVLGPKGCGKSTFLRAVASTLNKIMERTAVCYIDFACDEPKTPVELLTEALRTKFALLDLVPTTIAGLFEELKTRQLRAVLICDEFHMMYTQQPKVGDPWRQQIFQIGNAAGCMKQIVVTAFLSSSAPYLRELCFGKFVGDASRFPSYAGLLQNLNSSRFSVFSLANLDQTGLSKFCRDRFDSDIEELFALTNGNMCALEYFLQHKEPMDYFYQHASKWSSHTLLLKGIHHRLEILAEERGEPVDPMELVPLKELPDISPSDLYTAADGCAIRLHASDSHHSLVGFSGPLLAAFVAEKMQSYTEKWFTPQLRLCLRYPYGKHGVQAEEAFRRGVCGRFTREYSHCRLSITKKKKEFMIASPSKSLLRSLLGTVCQEIPDNYGADAVFAVESTDTITVYRVQLKLGDRRLCPGEVTDICHALTTGTHTLKSAYTKRLTRKSRKEYSVEFQHVLATTRPMTKKAKTAAGQVQLWDRDELATLWPSCVLQWAGKERLAQFLPVQEADSDSDDDDDDDDDEDEDEDEDED